MKKNVSALTLKVVLYRWKILSNNENPIMLRVTKNRQRKYVSLGLSCPLKFWDEKKNAPNRNHPNKDELETIISAKLAMYRDANMSARAKGKNYSAAGLVEMIEVPAKSKKVDDFFEEVYKRLMEQGKIGNAKTYKFVRNSFKKFAKKENREYTFSELNYTVLLKYETTLKSRGVGENSLSIHFRTIRSLFNMAIKENIADKNDYPFEIFKISKFETQANRRAISKEEVRKIEALELAEGTMLYEARQIFLFIYYGHGINYIDIAKLKWSNKNLGRISYLRSKTGKPINFAITQPIEEILNYWYPITGSDVTNYIFPILDRTQHITPIQIDNRIHKKIAETNNSFKTIGVLAGITTPLTTYVARHTFATTLKFSGVNTAIISEAMGHRSESTTQDYLKSFENSVIDDAVRNSL